MNANVKRASATLALTAVLMTGTASACKDEHVKGIQLPTIEMSTWGGGVVQPTKKMTVKMMRPQVKPKMWLPELETHYWRCKDGVCWEELLAKRPPIAAVWICNGFTDECYYDPL